MSEQCEKMSKRPSALCLNFIVILPNVQLQQRLRDNSAKTAIIQMSTNTRLMTFKKGKNEKQGWIHGRQMRLLTRAVPYRPLPRHPLPCPLHHFPLPCAIPIGLDSQKDAFFCIQKRYGRTCGQTDGQILLQRCEDASKRLKFNVEFLEIAK